MLVLPLVLRTSGTHWYGGPHLTLKRCQLALRRGAWAVSRRIGDPTPSSRCNPSIGDPDNNSHAIVIKINDSSAISCKNSTTSINTNNTTSGISTATQCKAPPHCTLN